MNNEQWFTLCTALTVITVVLGVSGCHDSNNAKIVELEKIKAVYHCVNTVKEVGKCKSLYNCKAKGE